MEVWTSSLRHILVSVPIKCGEIGNLRLLHTLLFLKNGMDRGATMCTVGNWGRFSVSVKARVHISNCWNVTTRRIDHDLGHLDHPDPNLSI